MRTSRSNGLGESFDVVVIGGGVLGTAVAARLSSTDASVCLLEAENDVCEGASKGNAGVAVSYYGPPGTLETELINRSYPRWEELCGRLGVPYRRIGGVMVALNDEEATRLEHTLHELAQAGVRGRALTSAQVRDIEPLVTAKCVAGLHHARRGRDRPDGTDHRLRRPGSHERGVGSTRRAGDRIERLDDGGSLVSTPRGRVRARFVVNAAGVHAAGLRRWPTVKSCDAGPARASTP